MAEDAVATFARKHRLTQAQARRLLKDAKGNAEKADLLAEAYKARNGRTQRPSS